MPRCDARQTAPMVSIMVAATALVAHIAHRVYAPSGSHSSVIRHPSSPPSICRRLSSITHRPLGWTRGRRRCRAELTVLYRRSCCGEVGRAQLGVPSWARPSLTTSRGKIRGRVLDFELPESSVSRDAEELICGNPNASSNIVFYGWAPGRGWAQQLFGRQLFR